VEPQHRDISMVFQSYALYPHMNVFENMAFALQLQKLSKTEVQKRVNEVAELLQISNLLERKPKELSGGQRQRVALGRALTRNTPVILFDEPLSNLDAHLRNQMRIEIKRLHQTLKNTMIYVTHDQMEATTMGDRIAVMREGRIEQLATPTEIYHRPQDLFVARFIGSPEMNFLEGAVLQKLPWSDAHKPGQIMGVRPEALKLAQGDLQKDEIILGDLHVELSENLGGQQVVHGFLDKSPVHILADSKLSFKKDQKVSLKADLTQIHVFDKQSGKNTRL
jgi:ABC-type sugar transport system ATPase subunit